MPKKKLEEEEVVEEVPQEPKAAETSETVSISKEQWDATQKQIKMLLSVADKGRVFSYEMKENSQKGKKPIRVKVSAFAGGYIIKWRSIKDNLIQHPTSGMTVGEEQVYEVVVLKPDNSLENITVNGYPRFSDARYNNREECDVISKSEDFEGNTTYDVVLPDGRTIKLAEAFLN